MHEVYSAGRSIFALEFSLDELLGNAAQRAETFRWLDFCLKSIVFHRLDAPVMLVGTGGDGADDLEKKKSNVVDTQHKIKRAQEMVGKHITNMAVYNEKKLRLYLPPQRLLPPVCVCESAF